MSEKISGRAKGGIARARRMTPEKRKEAAQKAALARWGFSNQAIAEYLGVLKVGDFEIPCAVLPDGRRVLSQRGIGAALGKRSGGTGENLPFWLGSNALKPFISEELAAAISKPILYRHGHGNRNAHGVEAGILPQICNVWLKARDADVLTDQQLIVARRADLLMRGFAHVGIISLIDEATGYQLGRARDALAQILEAFIAKGLQRWVQTFPVDFYQELFRLRGLPYPVMTVKRPQYFGVLTNNIIYDRLAPGVREELQKIVPRNEAGRPTAKYFQKLTPDTGYIKLREHLGSVVTLMKLSDQWDDFLVRLDKIHPRLGCTLPMNLEYRRDDDDGRGI